MAYPTYPQFYSFASQTAPAYVEPIDLSYYEHVIEGSAFVVPTATGGRSYYDRFSEGALVVRTKAVHAPEQAQPTAAMKAMDKALWEHLKKAIRRGVRTPVKGTTLYKLMRDCRSLGTSVDVKDSSYRSFRHFLESMEKERFLSLKPDVSDPVVLAINAKAVIAAPTVFGAKPSADVSASKGRRPSLDSTAAGTITPVSALEPSEQLDAEETLSVASQDARGVGETGADAGETRVGETDGNAEEPGIGEADADVEETRVGEYGADADVPGVGEAGADVEEPVAKEEDGLSSWFFSGAWFADLAEPDKEPDAEDLGTKERRAVIEGASDATPSASDDVASYQFNGDFRMVRTVASTDKAELNAEEGEAIYVVQIDESRRAGKLSRSWALAITVQGQQGLVPFDAIRREIYVTSAPFGESGCGYATLKRGDTCVVYHREGDWAFGARVEVADGGASFVEGWFPSPASPLPASPPSLAKVPARPAMSSAGESSPGCVFQ